MPNPTRTRRTTWGWVVTCALLLVGGCSTGMERIDRDVDRLLEEGSGTLGPDAYPPPIAPPPSDASTRVTLNSREADERPGSVNPPASALHFRAMSDAQNALDRLSAYNQLTGEPLMIDLTRALALSFEGSREYRFAQEDYILSALRLLIERHRWGPRFFDEVRTQVNAVGDDGFYNTTLELVNELRVTQRLPYGGEISARALASAVEDLHTRVATDPSTSAEVILDANIPLLRGAGLAARESRIQAERDLIYAAREFEEFRRDFLFDIAQDFLDLVVQQQSVANAVRQVEQLRLVEQRERALYESGRTDLFNAALAEQATVSAVDQLVERRETYRLDVDRFKVRLGLPVEQPVVIEVSGPDLPVPDAELDEAVRFAMAYRLDLQTQRDIVDDARRGVAIARNNMLPDLNATGSFTIPDDTSRDNFGLEPRESIARVGLSLGLPIDREIERLTLRQAQIQLERADRAFDTLRDTITVDVRGSVREIDRARFTLEIQERNIQIGEDRIESIAAAPDRATARDASEAADDLLEAKDNRDSALRDLQLAILSYLLETGQLRVTPDGQLQPLQGMEERPMEAGMGNIGGIDVLEIPGVIILPMPPAAVQEVPGEDQGTPPESNSDD